MRRFRTLTLFIATTLLSSPAISAPQGAKVPPPAKTAVSSSNSSEAWTFKAFAAPYGRFKATTTVDAVMVDNGVFRYTVQGPNYEIFKVHNPENKSYIQTTVTQYATQWAPPIKYPPFKKVGTGKMKDLDCIHYVCDTYHPNTTIDAWFTQTIPAQPGLLNSLCRICALPTGYGMPVKVVFKHPRKDELAFELLNLEKTRVTIEALLVPKGYRFIKDQALFFLSDEDGSNSGIDELMSSERPRRANDKKKPAAPNTTDAPKKPDVPKKFLDVNPKVKQLILDANKELAKKNFAQVCEKYSQAIELEPNDLWLRLARADTLFSLERFEESQKDLDFVLQKDPQNAQALMMLGGNFINLGNQKLNRDYYDRAAKEFSALIAIEPKNATAFNNRGLCYYMNGDYEKALADYTIASKLEPAEPKFVKNRATVFVQFGDFQRAKSAYLKALSMQPDNFYRFYDLGRLYLSQGDTKQAIENLTKCIDRNQSFADGYMYRGLAYFDKEEYPRAIADLSMAISKNTKSQSAYRYRGLAYSRMGDKVRAQKDLDRFADEEISAAHFEAGLDVALKSQGRDTADSLIAKGLKCEGENSLDDSIRFFSLAIEQDRHNPAPYKFRAHAYESKGELKKALADCDVSLWIEPFDAEALMKRASIYKRLGQKQKALWDLNRAISADPVLADPYFDKATLCEKTGKTQEALFNYQRFIKVALLSTDKGNKEKLAIATKALRNVSSNRKQQSHIKLQNHSPSKRPSK